MSKTKMEKGQNVPFFAILTFFCMHFKIEHAKKAGVYAELEAK